MSARHFVTLKSMSGRTYILYLLTSVMSLEAAAAPSLRLIWGFLAPSNRARANVPMDLQPHTQLQLT